MAYDQIFTADSTSKIIEVMVRNSSTGGGLTGLAYGSVTFAYWREGAATGVTAPCVTMTKGTWVTKGWVEVDATNQKGVYQFGIPDAALAAGVKAVTINFQASGMIDKSVRILLDPPVDMQKLNGISVDGTAGTPPELHLKQLNLSNVSGVALAIAGQVSCTYTAGGAGAVNIENGHANGYGMRVVGGNTGLYLAGVYADMFLAESGVILTYDDKPPAVNTTKWGGEDVGGMPLAENNYIAPDNTGIGVAAAASASAAVDAAAIKIDYQQRGEEVTLPVTPPSGYGGSTDAGDFTGVFSTSVLANAGAAVLVTPANKIATNASGQVSTSNPSTEINIETQSTTVVTEN